MLINLSEFNFTVPKTFRVSKALITASRISLKIIRRLCRVAEKICFSDIYSGETLSLQIHRSSETIRQQSCVAEKLCFSDIYSGETSSLQIHRSFETFGLEPKCRIIRFSKGKSKLRHEVSDNSFFQFHQSQ